MVKTRLGFALLFRRYATRRSIVELFPVPGPATSRNPISAILGSVPLSFLRACFLKVGDTQSGALLKLRDARLNCEVVKESRSSDVRPGYRKGGAVA
jgi:hypothetical protein